MGVNGMGERVRVPNAKGPSATRDDDWRICRGCRPDDLLNPAAGDVFDWVPGLLKSHAWASRRGKLDSMSWTVSRSEFAAKGWFKRENQPGYKSTGV